MFKAELLTGDFSENTMTFEIKGKMELKAGEYVILTKEDAEKPCRWEADSDGLYHTECGNMFYFDNGTVEENKQKFCGYCGKLIKPWRIE